MKKILLLGAIIASVNAYSLSFNGVSTGSGSSYSGGTISTSAGIFSGNVTINAGDFTLTLNPTDRITAGTSVTVAPGANFKVVNSSGTVIGTITGGNTFNFTNQVTGSDTSFNTLPAPSPSPSPSPNPTPTPTPIPGTPTTKVYIPRSKVDLELTKNITSSGFKSLEDAQNNNGTGLDIQYIGGAGRYTDNSQVIKYDSKSNGVALIGTKSFGNFTLGGGFGYQKSKVKYKETFDGIKENLDSYQFMLSGKYNFTENVDLASVLTYSHNSHKYENRNKVAIEGTKFNSNIIDFQTRFGSKFSGNTGYVKPYIGLGVTRVEEGAIDKLNASKARGTSGNANVGVYGQVALGSAVDLFGNVEYEHRFNRKSYHRDRDVKDGSKIEGLDYDSGMKLGLGLKYKFSKFNMTTAYELNDNKNNVFKVGFGAEF
ncbi:autotransporter outer membrane beta-barrel domain-containing protein [Leptotrichia sp. OH3620_COT-345]|uniref:autotransporter outer membrane beta-barrel domain-containing protein n=1 Tax=Leptotrichia sp. OH3620_COT-345 TaxID=2491048 RepID=UPI000F64AEEF|nr:autotransporter outer membrane beta-barrel domain-containing protein [Leptotrichia sp. OH3620_COT-345]RRD40703.1 autotransporter outer membrane beta-barrel domain-containing protein [Leptotrichia sp. OH3620_COT-345]